MITHKQTNKIILLTLLCTIALPVQASLTAKSIWNGLKQQSRTTKLVAGLASVAVATWFAYKYRWQKPAVSNMDTKHTQEVVQKTHQDMMDTLEGYAARVNPAPAPAANPTPAMPTSAAANQADAKHTKDAMDRMNAHTRTKLDGYANNVSKNQSLQRAATLPLPRKSALKSPSSGTLPKSDKQKQVTIGGKTYAGEEPVTLAPAQSNSAAYDNQVRDLLRTANGLIKGIRSIRSLDERIIQWYIQQYKQSQASLAKISQDSLDFEIREGLRATIEQMGKDLKKLEEIQKQHNKERATLTASDSALEEKQKHELMLALPATPPGSAPTPVVALAVPISIGASAIDAKTRDESITPRMGYQPINLDVTLNDLTRRFDAIKQSNADVGAKKSLLLELTNAISYLGFRCLKESYERKAALYRNNFKRVPNADITKIYEYIGVDATQAHTYSVSFIMQRFAQLIKEQTDTGNQDQLMLLRQSQFVFGQPPFGDPIAKEDYDDFLAETNARNTGLTHKPTVNLPDQGLVAKVTELTAQIQAQLDACAQEAAGNSPDAIQLAPKRPKRPLIVPGASVVEPVASLAPSPSMVSQAFQNVSAGIASAMGYLQSIKGQEPAAQAPEPMEPEGIYHVGDDFGSSRLDRSTDEISPH